MKHHRRPCKIRLQMPTYNSPSRRAYSAPLPPKSTWTPVKHPRRLSSVTVDLMSWSSNMTTSSLKFQEAGSSSIWGHLPPPTKRNHQRLGRQRRQHRPRPLKFCPTIAPLRRQMIHSQLRTFLRLKLHTKGQFFRKEVWRQNHHLIP